MDGRGVLFIRIHARAQYSIAVACIPVSVAFVVHQVSSAYNLLLIGRVLAGLLYGIMLITLLLHIADNSSQFMRRHFMATITLVNLLPTVLVAEFISTVTGFCDVTASTGVCMFVLAILTLIFMPCTYESIVFLLENGWDLRALEIMLKMRNESRHFIRRDFNEFKMMLVEDYGGDGGRGRGNGCGCGCCWCRNIFADGNSRPLILILLLRMLNGFLTSNCVYSLFLTNVWFDYKHLMGGSDGGGSDGGGSDAISTNTSINVLTTTNEDADAMVGGGSENVTSVDFNDIEMFSNNDTITAEMSTLAPTFNETMIPINGSLTDESAALAQTTIFDEIQSAIQNAAFSINFGDDDDGDVAITNDLSGSDGSVPNRLHLLSVTGNVTWYSDFFVRSAYSYRLPVLQIAQFLIAICIIKILVGIPFHLVVEKFQVYRNRAVYKVTLCIAFINLIFFMATWLCNWYDDSLLFTFYMAKLLSLIYGLYLLIAFSIDAVGYSELGESFSLTKRYGCIALIIAGEYGFHALAIALIMSAMFPFYLHVLQSAIICAICYALLKRTPNECLHCTLRSARDKYFVKMATTNN